MKTQNIIDTITIVVGIPSIITIIVGVGGMVSFALAIWDALTSIQKIWAIVGLVLFTLAVIVWLWIRFRQTYFIIPKLLNKAHKRAMQVLSLYMENSEELPRELKLKSLDIAGANLEEFAKALGQTEEEFRAEYLKQVKNISDTFGEPSTLLKLGWLMDSDKTGVDTILANDKTHIRLSKRIEYFMENPPNAQIAGAIKHFKDYSYSVMSALLYKDKSGYEALSKISESPKTTAYKYALPQIARDRIAILSGALNDEIRKYYKGV